jgi:hypothetical protein
MGLVKLVGEARHFQCGRKERGINRTRAHAIRANAERAYSVAITRVRLIIHGLGRVITLQYRSPRGSPEMDAVLTIAPPPCARMAGIAPLYRGENTALRPTSFI